ncbi:MAG: dockerin type I domain-containing protein [Planctomycetota bacterium]
MPRPLLAITPRLRPHAMKTPTRPRRYGSLLAIVGVACLAFACSSASAAINSFGSVNPSPPTTSGSDLIVGDEEATSNSPLGYVGVDDGTDLTYDRLVIGDEADYIGDVVVTGSGSSIVVTATSSSNPALQVGEFGTGYLSITDAGLVDVSDSSTSSGSNGTASLGVETTGAGFVTVDGRLSQFVVGDNLIIGEAGYGELSVTGGAFAYYSDPDDGTLVIGQAATGIGKATVDGAGSFWQLPQSVTIGVTGVGGIDIHNGATVDAANGFSGSTFTLGANGTIDLSGGGRLLTDAITVAGRLQGDGTVTGPVTVTTAGEVSAAAGETLRITGTVANQGLINISGNDTARAEIEMLGTVTNTDPGGSTPPGRITVADGVVRFNQPFTNNGVLSSTSGATDFHGTITNGAAGLIAIGGGSNATFYDAVNVTAGTLNIAAGSTALFLDDITISAGVSLGITLDASALEDDFDTPLQSAGLATLNAPIGVSLADGFVPSEGDTFELISATGGVVSALINPDNFDPLPSGLEWNVIFSSEGVSAVVVSGGIDPGFVIDGDYNGDNIVDAADYAVWRNSLNQTGGGLPADGNGDGIVDALDLNIWKQNFGRTNVGPPVLATASPEPTAVGLLGMTLLAGLGSRRRTVQPSAA